MNHLQTRVTRRRRQAGMRLGFAEYRFTRREVHRFLRAAGFAPQATYPNDLLPPRVMGLWVDRANLVFNPLGAKGAGEAGINAVGAAIASAIDDALGGGVFITRLPVTPQHLQALVKAPRSPGRA